MKEHCIEIAGLQAGYDHKIVINELDLKIPTGEFTMMIGANGCGKSTLLKTLCRILPARRGVITLNGTELKKQSSKEIARQMAVLPQHPSVPSGIRVKDLVAYGRFPYQSPMSGLGKHDLEMIDWAMEATGITDFKDALVDSLSGGQRQRAWIAMTLAQETPILVLDEPTTYLDMAHQLEILELLRKLNQEHHLTIIMVLHELNNAAKFATHLVGLKDGNIIFEGKPLDVITKENLKIIYNIDASLQLDRTGSYPICTDFELVSFSPL